jgi:hypothetical protein
MNVSRLKHDINAGRTGDKSPAFDPAAAPLGTDEEAAGTPVPPEAVDMARAHEIRAHGEEWSRRNSAGPSGLPGTGSGSRSPAPFGAGSAVLVAILIGLLGLGAWFAISGWRTAGEPDIGEVTGLGYAAMALGITATLGLGIGLMLLVFRSERR